MDSILQRLPISRRVSAVAGAFLVLGLTSGVTTIVTLLQDAQLQLGTDLLLLPAGLGILHGSVYWLRVSRIMLALSITISVLLLVMGAVAMQQSTITLGVFNVTRLSLIGYLVAGSMVVLLEIVAYRWIGAEIPAMSAT